MPETLSIEEFSKRKTATQVPQSKSQNKAISVEDFVNASTKNATKNKNKLPLSNKIANAFGFEKTTDTLGNLIARAQATDEEKQFIQEPTLKDIGGAALNIGATALPIGAAEKLGVSAIARVAPKLASPISKIGVGAGTGLALDTAQDLEADRTIAPGIGTALGAAIPGASLLKNVSTKGLASRYINSLIKPLQKQFSYGKDPGRTVSELGIVGNSLDELTKNISTARNDVGTKIANEAKSLPETIKINASEALSSFNKAIKKAIENNDQGLLNRLNEARNAITQIMAVDKGGKIQPVGTRILENLNYEEALKVKQRLGDLTKWTGQKTEDETVNGALTRAYGLLKEKMNQAAMSVSPEVAKNLQKLNEQYADLTSAEVASRYRDVLEKRLNLVNLPGKIGLATSAITAPFTGGVSTIALAIASIGVDKVVSSPAFKTRLAAWLAKAPKAEKEKLFRLYPQLIQALQGNE